QEVMAIRTRLYGEKDWRVTDARFDLEWLGVLVWLEAADRRRLWTAKKLHGQVIRLHQLGEARKALPLAKEAMGIHRQLLGEGHPASASSLNNLALLYQAMGEYGKGLPLLEEAKDLQKKLLGEAHPDYATTLNTLARLYQDMGEYGKALPLCEQA